MKTITILDRRIKTLSDVVECEKQMEQFLKQHAHTDSVIKLSKYGGPRIKGADIYAIATLTRDLHKRTGIVEKFMFVTIWSEEDYDDEESIDVLEQPRS